MDLFKANWIKKDKKSKKSRSTITAKDVWDRDSIGSGSLPDVTIDATLAFTRTVKFLFANACVIVKDSPVFNHLKWTIEYNIQANQTKLLKRESWRFGKLNAWKKTSFLLTWKKYLSQNRIYRDIEELYHFGAAVFGSDRIRDWILTSLFYREIVQEDFSPTYWN